MRLLLLCPLLLLLCGACTGAKNNVAAKPESQSQQPTQSQQGQHRFEIHAVQNGSFHGTAMLDTFTGRIWMLGSESKGGKVTSASFFETSVSPPPLPAPGLEPDYYYKDGKLIPNPKKK